MKKILITGKNSYLGTSLEKRLKKCPDDFACETLDMIEKSWINKDFSKFNVVFHVAAIVHKKQKKIEEKLFYEVNRDLAYKAAVKAKSQGVKHFIFLSTMSVYGISEGEINKVTVPTPTDYYGKSKLEAEKLLSELSCDSFKITILRPPMVYGKGCRGNYPKLTKIALKLPFFPMIENKRSMIYIDNLIELVKEIIVRERVGIISPQNKDYVNTSEMVKMIALTHNKKIILTTIFNPVIKILRTNSVKKVFGNLYYIKEMSELDFDYNICDFEKSIYKTEMEN